MVAKTVDDKSAKLKRLVESRAEDLLPFVIFFSDNKVGSSMAVIAESAKMFVKMSPTTWLFTRMGSMQIPSKPPIMP